MLRKGRGDVVRDEDVKSIKYAAWAAVGLLVALTTMAAVWTLVLLSLSNRFYQVFNAVNR